MFLKPIRHRKNGQTRTYWALVESYRTSKGPRHRTVAYLGELQPTERSGWAELAGKLSDQRPTPAYPLFHRARKEPVPDTIQVRVSGVRVERSRRFGDVYLALVLWRTLGLDELFDRLLPSGREQVPWAMVGAIMAISRFCDPSSELHVAQHSYASTALEDLLGITRDLIGKDRLYRVHDRILPLKDEIEKHLKQRYTTLFDTEYDLLLYDITSTYFEGQAHANPQAKRGHSRDHRSDCVQVCIGLIVTREGLPVAYEVFDGNRHDSTTIEQMVDAIEAKHGRANRVWVLDRGMVSEPNLQYIREHDGRYIVGTPKSMLKQYEKELLADGWSQVRQDVEVKTCLSPDGTETFILCRSRDRREKEKAMHERFAKRIEEALVKLAGRLDRAVKSPDRVQVERQIGRILQRNQRAAGLFKIKVIPIHRSGEQHLQLTWSKCRQWQQWSKLSEGCYLLRTNLTNWSAQQLWNAYIQLTQAESAFRTHKSQLALRPIWHHHADRVQAHILFSFLAYAMWKALEQWMVRSNLGNAPRTVLDQFAQIQLTDVVLPTSMGREIRLQCVTKPTDAQKILLSRLGLNLPQRLGEPCWTDEVDMPV